MSEPQRAVEAVGWRELVTLPDIYEKKVSAKIDTGARTSCLHADITETFDRDGMTWVRFELGLHDESNDPIVCELPVEDQRRITSSNGETEERFIVKTGLILGDQRFDAEFSLTNRSDMKFPILIGRTALKKRFLVDSGRSYLQSPREERQRLLGRGKNT